MRNPLPKCSIKLLTTDIMNQTLVALSLFVLSMDFNFYGHWFGCGFRLLSCGFHITVLDFDIQPGEFHIFIEFRRFHEFRGFQF